MLSMKKDYLHQLYASLDFATFHFKFDRDILTSFYTHRNRTVEIPHTKYCFICIKKYISVSNSKLYHCVSFWYYKISFWIRIVRLSFIMNFRLNFFNKMFSVSFGLVYPEYKDLEHVEVEGVWQIVFSTFVVYSMLPLR